VTASWVLTGPGPQVPVANALLALCASVDFGDDLEAWCQRDFLQTLRPLLVALTPGSRGREADLAALMLEALPPCLHHGPENSLSPFDAAHATSYAMVGSRSPGEAAERIEKGVL
jgi:hypothetical protein